MKKIPKVDKYYGSDVDNSYYRMSFGNAIVAFGNPLEDKSIRERKREIEKRYKRKK